MKKIYMHSLGCSKNLVDSENMLGILTKKGYKVTDYADKADYIIINTCSFINDAQQESVNAIISAADIKNNVNKKAKIVVTGCLSQRFGEELAKEIPEVDVIIGTSGFEKIDEYIHEYEKKKELVVDTKIQLDIDMDLPRNPLTSKWYAYLKIAEGCSNNCTYCVIPQLRGPYKSRKIESIVEEAKSLAKNGAKEIIIIAQDTSKYGLDVYNERKLHEVIQKVSEIEEVQWIRVHYLYPEDIYDELIDEFKNNPKLLKYFDIPMQHINDRILKRMNRNTSSKEIKGLIEKIRKEVEGAVIRTSLITGFPGETEEEHEELKQFLQEYKLDRVGIFKYSREENTPAYRLPDQIDEEVMEQRHNELMELQLGISYENSLSKIGRTYDVLIEEKDVENIYVGRTYMDSIEIDGCVYVTSDEELVIGNIYKVNINDALEYDLIGDVVDGLV
ncbi:Ribosomal protein S12 methylthiotransferase RimO [bioreactor metagenome]|uniref:Ribosomal protein uS12 methylthiotransferase RimO n=2 Tax=root TaxID=1 RepID=A0A562JGR7_9FIRM|nr:30S ribosomal protein S12 methylthiotransferase RimO [Sedimentibacter saalensis]MEA5094290.1 30S ribosomal protein S12 methylthiotransferase RimO [Sedimentibacter saalensis]TWH82350.1 SSU ribosomal protein S12P methylthiotransferase [Sedimentibacter saalensis]